MARILGIETSCDETAAAVFDTDQKKILSSHLFSQVELHDIYGGVVPEIASRSHLEKIDTIIAYALEQAKLTLDDIDYIAVTQRPGLVGSLLIGISFAKGMAWATDKKLIGVNHLEGHIFSSFLREDGTVDEKLSFPYLCLSISGGHTALYIAHSFGEYELLGKTLDDAAGEAFDKVAALLGLGYPGGPLIEKYAAKVDNKDFYNYPRTKNIKKLLNFSFSGLKTAVLYDLVKRGAFDLKTGIIKGKMTLKLQQEVASSLQVCIADICEARIKLAFEKYPEIKAFAFVGGVACNKFIRGRLKALCDKKGTYFVVPPMRFCSDNGAMIAFVGSYKAEQGAFSSLEMDVFPTQD